MIEGLQPLTEFRGGQTLRLPRGTTRHAVIGSGWAARYKLLSDGRRQIVSLLLPGDLLQCGDDEAPEAGLPLTTLTAVRILNAKPILAAVDGADPEHCELRKGLAKARSLSEAQMIDQIIRLGAQNGLERIVDLFGELQARLDLVGLADDGGFQMPLTQECLADTLGLSIVHVNRTLQHLRRERLIELSRGWLRILEPALLTSIAEYDSSLH